MGQDESIDAYRAAERRIRLLLLGDGTYEAGVVRGEEARARVNTQLRHLRAAFDEVLARNEEDEARILDLEKELSAQAAAAKRRAGARRKT
jgi:hypothetical protein